MPKPLLLCLGLLLMTTTAAQADVSLAQVFGENVVLQRDTTVPVWGRAAAGEKVTVTVLDGEAKLATGQAAADEAGRWRVDLDPMPAGGRYTLLVEGKGSRLVRTNVMVGEVWITCGQSNNLWPLSQTVHFEEAAATAGNYPKLRHLQVGRRDPHRLKDADFRGQLEGYWGPAKWERGDYVATRSNQMIPGSPAAVSHYFARKLYDQLGGDVPVGMIDVTAILPAQSWVSEQAIAADPVLAPLAGKRYPDATSLCYKANIEPLAPFAARGVIYYQGEMNGGQGRVYRHALSALIDSWRAAFERPTLPFVIVQLPGFVEHKAGQSDYDMDAASLKRLAESSENHGFCPVRQAQLQVHQNTPHTGLAVTIDLGEPYDIHPPLKRPVAERVFIEARDHVYENDNALGSPLPVKYEAIDGGYRVTFDDVGEGLVAAEGGLDSFELQTPGGDWIDAQAAIVGQSVEVRSDAVKEAAGVRYAWAGYPRVTLFNSAGLPASPFIHPSPID